MSRDTLDIVPIRGSLPEGFDLLLVEARREGHEFLDRLHNGFGKGSEAYDGPREGAFAAFLGGRLAGVGSIAVDPYLGEPEIGRLRHVFVGEAARRKGIAEALVTTCLERGRGFALIRLRTRNPDAARLYERLGFTPVALEGTTHVYRPSAAPAGSG
ncbi:Acetyltransferase (GNAT) family protein [Rhizobiales bacterium GAS191]|nr:Acetyltransferase (GNAT) family protein [Rhizobiales bacterium GAS191]